MVDRILRPGLQVVLVAVAATTLGDASALAIAWAAPYAVAAVLAARALVVAMPRGGRSTAAVPADLGRDFWRFTWPRAVARIAQVAIQKADIVIVAWLISPTAAATYTVATRFVVFGQLASQAVSSVVQPRFTAILLERDDAALGKVFTISTCWSVLLAWPVYLAVAAAPSGYLGWFGDAYTVREASLVAVVMAASMLVAVASGPVDTLLLMAGRSGWSQPNTLAALAVDVGLCLLLIPRLGIVGAAVAWGVAVSFRCALATVQLRIDVRLAPDLRTIGLAAALPVVCLALPLLVLHQTRSLGPGVWLAATALAATAYAAVAWRLRGPLAIDLLVRGLRRPRPVKVRTS